MTDLSPAAQAGELILAYRKGGDEVPHPLGLAAALRAAALYCKRDSRILLSLADELEGDIAAELEGANG